MFFLSLLIGKALAAVPNGIIPDPPNSNIPRPSNGGFDWLIRNIIDILFAFAGSITLIVIVYLSYQMITSHGKDEQFKKALNGITYAAIGLTIMGLAYAVMRSLVTINF